MISPIPDRGPLASHLISFAILNKEAARVFSEPDNSTILSCVATASNLFEADLNGNPVIEAIFSATDSANPSYELIHVPTAVPPIANS